ncbi:cleavage stimulation factor subunit 1-like isoform X2 [Xenia sp. Carnegie-2017]|uniref:cleavage stimulation factor subunit 1-like isoform X2 n=1 Tax=Xenia sp. Carnegie-2017 TaxID=2897299 RepID=UPI001F04DB52|nr:cleavage stimulation factor subunit 1-like isoform X2 [Xenia sp. Carnegie-2017]
MSSILEDREKLYRLMISQLRYDGLEDIAMQLTQEVRPKVPCPPSAHLFQQVKKARHADDSNIDANDVKLPGLTPPISTTNDGFDLEVMPKEGMKTPEIGMYETYYVTAHKGPCRAACFNRDGKLIATGSADCSIKVLDVDRMIVKTTTPSSKDHGMLGMENHPVIRTLYDHVEEVTTLAFHPSSPVLVSGSRDFSIKFFDISKPSIKKAYRTIQEVETIRSLSFHPSGDYLLVATDHPTIRLYDVNSLQCYAACSPREFHNGPITQVCYSLSGHLYASTSKDGCIKVWDGVSNRCISTFPNAHNGNEVELVMEKCFLFVIQWHSLSSFNPQVSSVTFSKNSKYLLTSGKDSLIFLWELSSGRAVSMYTGAKSNSQYPVGASFNHTEDYILMPDSGDLHNPKIASWDARSTEKLKLLSSGHTNTISGLQHSPTASAFVSCSDDNRARFWYSEGI